MVAPSRLRTGIANRWRIGLCQADKKHTSGIENAPTTNSIDESHAEACKTKSQAGKTNARFKKPVPKNEMCPSLIRRRLHDPNPPIHSSRWKKRPIRVPLTRPARIALQAVTKFKLMRQSSLPLNHHHRTRRNPDSLKREVKLEAHVFPSVPLAGSSFLQ